MPSAFKTCHIRQISGLSARSMACPGGCVAGAGTMQQSRNPRQLSVCMPRKQTISSSETEYIKELDKLVD